MKERVKRERDKVRKRNLMTEHIFGTMKRNFNQGYFLMRGIDKVSAEMGLTMLAYNIKRVLKIVGFKELITELMVKGDKVFNYTANILIKIVKFITQRQNIIHDRLIYGNPFYLFHTI